MHMAKKGMVINMNHKKRIAGCFGIFVLLFGLYLTLTVAAIDTPWIPLEPNTTVLTEEKTQPPESSATDSEEITVPLTQELTEIITDSPTGEASREEPGAPATAAPQNAAESESRTKQKAGCGSVLSGTVLLLPLAFAVAIIGRKKSI